MEDIKGFVRVAGAIPEVKIADINHNVKEIIEIASEAEETGAEVIVFPELSITGYTCADLFYQSLLLDEVEAGLRKICECTRRLEISIVVGAPLRCGNGLYNCAVFISGGEIIGIVPKTYLPNYNEFYEKRWFRSAKDAPSSIFIDGKSYAFSRNLLFEKKGVRYGIEICEDMWVPVPPATMLTAAGADIILNLSATDEMAGKHDYLVSMLRQHSARCRCGYVYASAGIGESSTDLAFAGNCLILEDGAVLASAERFCMESQLVVSAIDVEKLRNDRLRYSSYGDYAFEISDIRTLNVAREALVVSDKKKDVKLSLADLIDVSPTPFVDDNAVYRRRRCNEISSIQAWGLAQRLRKINCRNAVIGISGGLDSTLALLVTVKAFDMLKLDRKGILAVTMPGFGTTDRTHNNAWQLMELLGVTPLEIPINPAVTQHFSDIGHDPEVHDATYENSQARERTQILMDLANKTGGLVIGTGDLSELALGWCTYNGDQMSMYGVNASIPKTLVKYLVLNYSEESSNSKIKEVLIDILETPISPELLPSSADGSIEQKTEDLVGPYELHDFFLYYMLRDGFEPEKIYRLARIAFAEEYDKDIILHWLKVFYRRFFSQQFKRSCMPDGVKVGSVCLSPRGDWRMPSDASARLWLEAVEHIK